MRIKNLRRHPVEFVQPSFGIRPETFDPVDVNIADGKHIVRAINREMFAVTDINQFVVVASTIRMNHRIEPHLAAKDVLQRYPRDVRHDPGINFAVSFIESEEDGFMSGSATAFAAHPPRSEISFVNFNLARSKRRGAHRLFGDTISNFQVNSVDAPGVSIRLVNSFPSRQIKREILDNLANFALANFSAPIISA